MQSIALFGGSFDPVHLGHVMLASAAVRELQLDEVRYIPCLVSPHKLGMKPVSAELRLNWLKLTLEDVPWAVVDDFEIRQTGTTYSLVTAQAMKSRYPLARLFWIMGADQWEALPRWHEPQRLAELVEFIVMVRGDEQPEPRAGYRMHRIEGAHPASSSEIRAAFGRGDCDAVREWIHPDVWAEMLKTSAYR